MGYKQTITLKSGDELNMERKIAKEEWHQQPIEIIKERDIVLFVGSGISFDPPAMLPSWTEVTEEAIRSLCSERLKNEQKELISRGGNIRPEVLIDIMRGVIGDKAIGILDVLKSEDFNMNHVFLAYLILNHNVLVITTNYDELVETAAKRIFRGEILHVYHDKKGFREWLNSKEKTAGLFKLHGTISREESIKAALSQVAAGSLSEPVRELLKNFSENYHITFWGYSLTDDFDIVPVLFETQPKRVKWIIHRRDSKIPEHREEIREKLKEEEKGLEECLSKLLRGELSPKDRGEIQKKKNDHQKKANYMRLFLKAKDFGTESYSPKLPIPFWEDFQGLLSNERRKKAREFSNPWSAEINEWDRLLIGAEVFFYLREERGSWQKVINLCDRAINILKMQGDDANPEKLIHAYFLKGWAHRLLGTKEDKEKAIESFEQTEKLFEKLPCEKEQLPSELLNKKAEILHQKGIVFQRMGDHSSALQYLDEALKIRRELGDKANIAFSEFQKFMVEEDKYKWKYPSDYIDYMMNLEKQLTEAQKELNETGDLRRASTLLHNIAFIHQRIGEIEIERGSFEQGEKQLIIALDQYNEALEKRKLIFEVGGITMARSRLAECHYDLAKIALNQGKRKQALGEINKSRKHVEEASEIYARMRDLYRQDQVERAKERINELEKQIKNWRKK